MKVSINPRCIYRQIGNKTLVEHLDSPLCRQVLGGVGSEIWAYLDKGMDTETIIRELGGRFKVPAERLQKDVYGFIRDLHKLDLVEVSDSVTLTKEGDSESQPSAHDDRVVSNSTTPNLYQQLIEEVEAKNMVIKAHLEVTYRCNFSCVQCYVGPLLNDRLIARRELTTHELRDLITQLAEQGCLGLTFTGGELFCRKDIVELLEHTSRRRCGIRIQTNGTLITDEIAKRLAQINTIETIEVSFYAMDPEMSDAITRVSGSLERAIKALERLSRERLPVYLKYVLMRQNIDGLDKARELADKFGVRFVTGIGNIYPTTTGNKKNLEYQVPEDVILKLFAEGKVPVPEISEDCFVKDWLCRAGVVRCTITPTGDVWPCERVPFSFGNIKQQSFKEVWFSERAEWYRSMTKEEHSKCKECGIKQFCSQCWAMPYLYGDGISVEEALALKGYSEANCRLTKIIKKGHELVHTQTRPTIVYSQVF